MIYDIFNIHQLNSQSLLKSGGSGGHHSRSSGRERDSSAPPSTASRLGDRVDGSTAGSGSGRDSSSPGKHHHHHHRSDSRYSLLLHQVLVSEESKCIFNLG